MKKVLKYPLQLTDDQTVVMPEGAQILAAQVQADGIMIWALCPETRKVTPRRIEMFDTGSPIPNGTRTYIGTCLLYGGSQVVHIFERP
jgi:hypothetical protein